METMYKDRIIFCSAREGCERCEFLLKCDAIPEKKFFEIMDMNKPIEEVVEHGKVLIS